MAVLGTLLAGAVGGFGKKPNVPAYDPVDPTKEQGKAIAGNQANLGAAQKLAADTNKFNLGQLQEMLRGAMPGYDSIQGKISSNLQSQLAGELPADVQAQIQNNAAAKAVGGGYGGSGAHGSLVARDFGMTSYDMQNRAMDTAMRWTQMTAQMAVPSMMNVSSMFLTPQQRIAYSFENKERQFQKDWLSSQVDAAPDPFNAALGQAFIEDEKAIMEMVGGVAGMAGGMMCWVAREVYEGDPKWKLFRHWLINIGPKWFMNLYRKHGEQFAQWLHKHPALKPIIRRWMDKKVEVAYANAIRF